MDFNLAHYQRVVAGRKAFAIGLSNSSDPDLPQVRREARCRNARAGPDGVLLQRLQPDLQWAAAVGLLVDGGDSELARAVTSRRFAGPLVSWLA